MDLTEFLAARLDEDEAAAKAVAPLGHVYDMGGTRLDETLSHSRVRYASEDGRSQIEPDQAALRHFARYDPARALREVAAKRAIIGLAATASEWTSVSAGATAGYAALIVKDSLRALAAVYSNHPDYRAEWKP